MEPFQKVQWRHRGGTLVVVDKFLSGQRFGSGTRRAPSKERFVVLQNSRGVGSNRIRSRPHPSERRCMDQSRPGLLCDRDTEPAGKTAHLRIEVVDEVVVVDENDILGSPTIPRIREVPQHSRERVERVPGIDILFDPPEQPLVKGWTMVGNRPGLRPASQPAYPLPVEVPTLVVERDGRIQGVTPRHDVGHPSVYRQSIEGRVGLDEPAVSLPGQLGVYIGTGCDQPVEPR